MWIEKSMTQTCSFILFALFFQLHTGQGLLNCPTCNKTFFTQSALTGHMAVHMDIQPFECSLCGKRYKHAKALQLHLEDHEGTRQTFPCSECDRTFKVRVILLPASLHHLPPFFPSRPTHPPSPLSLTPLPPVFLHLEDHEGTRQTFPCSERDRTFKVRCYSPFLITG